MSFFKTRFFCVLLSVAIILTLVPTIFAATGNTYILKNAVNSVLTPFRAAVNSFCDAVEGYGKYFSTVDELRAENEELKMLLGEYMNRVEELEGASRDYEWLAQFMKMKKILEKCEYFSTGICDKTAVGGAFRYTIDSGSLQGIKKEMVVLCGDGLFGKVTEVGLNWATVCTPLDTTVSFGAANLRTKERGYTQGDIRLCEDGTFKVCFLSSEADVVPGDTIVTVGNEYLPDGITLGTVESVTFNEYDRTKEACVRPLGNYDYEYSLMVVISHEYVLVDSGEPDDGSDTGTSGTDAE